MNDSCPSMVARGGGVLAINAAPVCDDDPARNWVRVAVDVDTCEAMGANIVTTLLEGISPQIEAITGARCIAKIISNLTLRRLTTVRYIRARFTPTMQAH